jgi:pre-rRNA-processing protein TSR4
MSATEDKKAVPETEVDEEEDDNEHAEPEEEEKDDLDNDDDQEPVLLGFVQDPVHIARCRRQYFPSKVGGKPVSWSSSLLLRTQLASRCRRG